MSSVSIFSDHACHLGEGPLWHAGRERAFWVDILERRVLSRGNGGGMRIYELPFHPSMLATVDGDRLLLAGTAGLSLLAIDDGAVASVLPYWDSAATRTNDGRVHPSGALWISTMGWGCEPGLGAIWWYRRGELRRILPSLTIPNAICFSPDGRRAHFADGPTRTIFRLDVDPATGLPCGEARAFVRLGDGVPDGAVVDGHGVLWNARWGSGAVDAYAPDGARIATIALPARRCTCPAFAGRDLDAMIVTSAYEGYDAAARAADPDAGRTFRVEGAFAGRAEPLVLI